jgi:hypothetical protein
MFALLFSEHHAESQLRGIRTVAVAVQGAVARSRPLVAVLVPRERRLIQTGQYGVAALARAWRSPPELHAAGGG